MQRRGGSSKKGAARWSGESCPGLFFWRGRMASRSGTRTSWRRTPRFEDTKEYIEAKVSPGSSGRARRCGEARDLIIISAPNEVEPTLREPGLHPAAGRGHKKDRVSPSSTGILRSAARNLRSSGGSSSSALPGTGKTSLALAIVPGTSHAGSRRSVSRWSPPSTLGRDAQEHRSDL